MSTPERDPFELLPRFVDPEPDPVVMEATIAQSREAFLRHRGHGSGARSSSWLDRLRPSLSWIVPTAVGVAAVAMAVVITPGLLPVQTGDLASEQSMAEAPALSRGEDAMVADAPSEPSQDSGGIRMGAQPAPMQPPADLDSLPMSILDGDNIQLGFRQTPSALLLYLPDVSTDEPFDSQHLLEGETAEVLAAFGLDEGQVVAVQFRIGTATFWQAYRAAGDGLARDAELTALLSDAPDLEEARKRIETR